MSIRNRLQIKVKRIGGAPNGWGNTKLRTKIPARMGYKVGIPVAFGLKPMPSPKARLRLTCGVCLHGCVQARNCSTHQVSKYLVLDWFSAKAAEVLRKDKGFSHQEERVNQSFSPS